MKKFKLGKEIIKGLQEIVELKYRRKMEQTEKKQEPIGVVQAIEALNNGHVIKTINEKGVFIFHVLVTCSPVGIQVIWSYEADDVEYTKKRPESLEDLDHYTNEKWAIRSIVKSEFFICSVDDILVAMQRAWDETHKEKEET